MIRRQRGLTASATLRRVCRSAFARRWKLSLSIIAALVVLAGALQLARPGYSVDEEFTVFAVRGISAHGLPLLPSGLLYDRGLAYSYAGWIATAVSGAGLPAYRALSLLSAVAAIALIFSIVQRLASTEAAAIASLLVATSIPFWTVATTARFYAPFMATYLGTLAVLCGSGNLVALFVLGLACRLTHELAFTLAAVPLVCLVLAPRVERGRWIQATLVVVAGLAAAQAAIFALHFVAPAGGETMIKRFFLWQVLNLFETPPDRQFGIALVVMVIAWIVAPSRARPTAVVALCGVAMILGISIGRALRVAPISLAAIAAILEEGSRYPLDMFRHLARHMPLTLVLTLALLACRLTGLGGPWHLRERAIHLMWIGWVLWFGVIESGITTNYLLMPVAGMLIAIAVDLVAITQHVGARREKETRPLSSLAVSAPLAGSMLALLVVLAAIADEWRGSGSVVDRLEVSRPTIVIPGIETIRDGLQPADRVACTDELACLMLIGRADAWLALDDYVRERFVVRRTPLHGVPGDEAMVGVYAGAPAVFRPADLFGDLPDGRTPERVLIVDVFKDYPVGDSRAWLPRAIAADGLEARTLLDTPHARVVEISPPVRNARRQP